MRIAYSGIRLQSTYDLISTTKGLFAIIGSNNPTILYKPTGKGWKKLGEFPGWDAGTDETPPESITGYKDLDGDGVPEICSAGMYVAAKVWKIYPTVEFLQQNATPSSCNKKSVPVDH